MRKTKEKKLCLRKSLALVSVIAMLAGVTACGSSDKGSDPAKDTATDVTAEAPELTTPPEETPELTATPKPTETPKATSTPKPTSTPRPTSTPKPTPTPEPIPTNNIVKNATFDKDTTGWGLYTESGGEGSLSAEDGRLALNITSLGTLNYAVQLYPEDTIALEQGKEYRVRYEIYSTEKRSVEVMIQQNGGSYQSYTWKKVDLKTTPQQMDYTFTMTSPTDGNTKLAFNCGTQGTNLPAHTIYVDNVVVAPVEDASYGKDPADYVAAIRLNQVGYQKDSEKIAVLCDMPGATKFSVVNAENEEVVYTGDVTGEKYNSGAKEINSVADFSAVTEAGRYYVTCGAVKSYTFEIADTVYDDLLKDMIRMFYLQRCGCEVTDETFGHAACHTGIARIYGTEETIDVTGGWHDAGDYGRYVVAAAKSVADLLYAYEAMEDAGRDDIGIPESGNGIPDLLDEVRYELEWMLKMQAPDGGVYHKVSCASFPGYVMPEKETGLLLVTPVSTTATGDFCASMAMAYEFYYDIDKAFAEKCLAAAEKAWAFLEANPKLIFENPAAITTGAYNDGNDKDERYWAAAQMYRATKDEKYLSAFEAMSTKTGLDWSTVGDYGNIAILTMDGVEKESQIYSKAYNAILNQAKRYEQTTSTSAYGVAITTFHWGSNMTVSNAGVILGLAYELTGEEKYLTAAEANKDYLLGCNPVDTCFVSGYGTVSPKNPHHRPSMAKKQAMVGMLAGGVNSNLEDPTVKAKLKDVPTAKRYLDHKESYSTNEITIYWNSPFIYLMSLTDK